LRNELETDALS